MIGRAEIEGFKNNVAINAWLPQANYLCGTFSDASERQERDRQNHARHDRDRQEFGRHGPDRRARPSGV